MGQLCSDTTIVLCQREMNEENVLLRPAKARSGTNKFAFLVRKNLKNDNALTQTCKQQTK